MKRESPFRCVTITSIHPVVSTVTSRGESTPVAPSGSIVKPHPLRSQVPGFGLPRWVRPRLLAVLEQHQRSYFLLLQKLAVRATDAQNPPRFGFTADSPCR